MSFTKVCTLDDIWEGEMEPFTVNGHDILLVCAEGGEIKAFQGMCPHQEVLLVDGDWNPDKNVLQCPGHRWEFDMTSGKGINPAGCQLYEFAVQVEGDEVRVGVPTDGLRHHNRFQT